MELVKYSSTVQYQIDSFNHYTYFLCTTFSWLASKSYLTRKWTLFSKSLSSTFQALNFMAAGGGLPAFPPGHPLAHPNGSAHMPAGLTGSAGRPTSTPTTPTNAFAGRSFCYQKQLWSNKTFYFRSKLFYFRIRYSVKSNYNMVRF